MENLDKRIKKEYDRWYAQLELVDPYLSETTIGIKDVLRAHFLIVDYFYKEDEGLGGIGPRDLGLLHSALYRQFSG